MNATFRRDYLYQDNNGRLLRYLKYDRATSTYLFLTGARKSANEELVNISIGQTNTIKKLYCNGYDHTDGYPKQLGKTLRLAEDFEIGGKYKFNNNNFHLCTDLVLTHTELVSILDPVDLVFTHDDHDGYQVCDPKWLTIGVTAQRVG